jgi:O-antigen ligase
MRKIAEFLVYIFVFTVPWDETLPVPGIGTITRMIGLALAGVTGLTVLVEGRLRKPDIIFAMALAFVVSNVLSLLWTISLPATMQAVWTYSQLLGSVWVLRELARTEEQQERMLVAFCLGTFVPIASLMFNFVGGSSIGEAGRYTAAGWNADGIGMLLALAIPIAWHLLQTRRGTIRVIAIAYLALAPIGIMLTAARGAFLAALVALLIVPLSLASQLRLLFRVAAVVALIILAVVPTVPTESWERKEIWAAGLRAFPEHPLLGVGAGAFGRAVESQQTTRFNSTINPHNTMIGLLVEHGVIGLLPFIGLLAAIAWTIAGMRPPYRLMWATVMACWLVGTLSLSLDRWKATWLLIGMLAAHGVEPLRRSVRNRKQAATAAEVRPAFHPIPGQSARSVTR